MCRSASVAPLTPTYHLWSPAGDKPWYLYRGKAAVALHLNLTLGETNEGREAISLQHRAQSCKMRFWCGSGKATRIHGLRARDRSQPGENRGNSKHEASQTAPRCPKIDRLSRSTQSVHLQMGRESPTSLPTDEKIAEFCLG